MNYFVNAPAALFICFSIHLTPAANIDSIRNILANAPASQRIEINYEIAAQYFSQSPDSAMLFYNEALRLSREMKNDTFTARSLNKIAILNYNSGAYDKAISNFYQALQLFERLRDDQRTIRCMQYLGMAYNIQGMHGKAADFARQSLEMAASIGDQASMAVAMTNLGSVYFSKSDYDSALIHFEQALQISQESDDRQRIADALNNVALIYEKKKNTGKALEFHLRSLSLAKELGDNMGVAASYHNIGLIYKEMRKFPVAIQYLDSCMKLASKEDDKFTLKESYNTLAELYSNTGNFESAYNMHLLYSGLNDTLMSEENKRQFAEMNAKYETEKKDKQISLLNKDSEKQKIIRNGFVGGFTIVLLFAGIFLAQRNKIKKGKQRSDELLLNILPEETAEELKLTGEAQAKQFNEVTVMFTDFKNFTQASEKLSATELVHEIHHCYSEFDKIISRHGLEKIKTIGDSYMCAGGLPVPNKTNAEDIVKAALEICEFMKKEKQKGKAEGKTYFEIRIGCHTGPVVAGIVGIKKFAYDIWGDTVNIAARMEQNSEAGKINISGATYELVKEKFNFTHRGKVLVKNKGEIDMYFVENSS